MDASGSNVPAQPPAGAGGRWSRRGGGKGGQAGGKWGQQQQAEVSSLTSEQLRQLLPELVRAQEACKHDPALVAQLARSASRA